MRLGECTLSQRDAAVFTYPRHKRRAPNTLNTGRPAPPPRIDLYITAARVEALLKALRYSFSSQQALTRYVPGGYLGLLSTARNLCRLPLKRLDLQAIN